MLVSVDGPVATITFNRPEKLNAADLAQCHGLEAAVAAVGAEPGVRVVLLRGAGRSFGSGIDRDMLADGMPPDFVPSHERSYAALEDMDKLVVGVLHGHCLGAGLLAALACDLRICSTDAVLGLTAARFGLFPAMGTFRLPRLIGLGPARRLILSGETVDPAEAYRTVRAELAAHGAGLERLPEIVVLSKRDLVPDADAERAVEAWRERLGDSAAAVLAVSSATGAELALLTRAIFAAVPELGPDAEHAVAAGEPGFEAEHMVYAPAGDGGFEVVREDDSFRVLGRGV